MAETPQPPRRDPPRSKPDSGLMDLLALDTSKSPQVGVGLTREFWDKSADTVFGRMTRRAYIIVLVGLITVVGVMLLTVIWRMTTPPNPQSLPEISSLTVMQHVYANFSGNYEGAFVDYTNDSFNADAAYTFTWIDSSERRQEIIIMSYSNMNTLESDYLTATSIVNPTDGGIVNSLDTVIERRMEPSFGGRWLTMRLGNVLMLLSPTTLEPDRQELMSHFVTIMATNHRDAVPTPTPF